MEIKLSLSFIIFTRTITCKNLDKPNYFNLLVINLILEEITSIK